MKLCIRLASCLTITSKNCNSSNSSKELTPCDYYYAIGRGMYIVRGITNV
jgi:hypothetical protein